MSEPTRSLHTPQEFDAMYAATPPWDIGHPQPALEALAGEFRGRVLDIGCGTGEHALMAAHSGLEATGIDSSPAAIEIAKRKARERRLNVRFLVHDALQLDTLGEKFDTVLDMGLFHVFSDPNRTAYVESLKSVTAVGARYFMVCFSEHQPGDFGPRRVTQAEIRQSFHRGWHVDGIEPATLQVNIDPAGIKAWLARITRTDA